MILLAASLTACVSDQKPASTGTTTLSAFQAKAAAYHSVVTVPTFETTTNEVQATVARVIADGNAALDRIGALTPS